MYAKPYYLSVDAIQVSTKKFGYQLCHSVDTILSGGWLPLLDKTKTGKIMLYTNFDNFLHYGQATCCTTIYRLGAYRQET
ncbi:uncharacterized protein SCHCODRAFT_01213054 [Schizophyllum commune H4-8]|uniref:uncharacterized protein n=1 Tax=Schizophyllum commune (strain H4-8 / FGSC 9210) TaxID=578458 RepID=UPI002160773C|nr:uncharacterized protein SCHCODRAFT_01213054 [Schizophyllum commune H4-8]KAI5892466.1 hypothetical protein SCHCODRAFT_01213054 [Schizophyllum commune H4-8]